MAIALTHAWSPRTSTLPLHGASHGTADDSMAEAMAAFVSNLLGTDTASTGEVVALADALGGRVATDWFAYLARLPSQGAARVAERLFRDARARVRDQTGRSLSVPMTIRGDDGSLHLAWDAGRHYVDVDVFTDGTIEWFYRDRTTETLDGPEDPCPASPLPRGLVARLGLVAR